MRLSITFVMVIIGVVAVGCSFGPTHWVEERGSLELAVEAGGELSVRTHNGTIDYEGTAEEGSSTRVDWLIRSGGRSEEDARDALESIHIDSSVEEGGGRARVGWRWKGDKKRGWGANVRFHVVAPPGIGLRAVTHNGRIRVAGAGDPIEAVSHNGEVRVAGEASHVRVRTHNGPVLVTGPVREADLETHNGSIDLSVTEGGPLSGSAETHNGSITVRVAADASARFETRTHNGRLSTSGPIEVVERKRRGLVASIGKPGISKFKAGTHNGSVRLEAREAPRTQDL